MIHCTPISKMKTIPAYAVDFRDLQALVRFLSDLVGLSTGVLGIFTGLASFKKPRP